MTEKPLSTTAEELAAMPEDEFLELCRDCDQMSSEYAFKSAGIHTLEGVKKVFTESAG